MGVDLERDRRVEVADPITRILGSMPESSDRVWFERSVRYTDRWESGHRRERFDTEEGYRVSIETQQRFKAKRSDLRPAEGDCERGMWNGKLSTLRWLLGSECDFLDT